MPLDLHGWSAVFVLGFAGLAFVDGVYLHLWRYRLFARPEARYEHGLHTVRALLFPVVIALVYSGVAAGPALFAGTAAALLDLAVQIEDMRCERAARRRIGGLSTPEYVVHGTLTMFHVAATSLALAARPAAAWSAGAPAITLPAALGFPHVVVLTVLPGAVALAALHVWLLRPQYAAAASTAPRARPS